MKQQGICNRVPCWAWQIADLDENMRSLDQFTAAWCPGGQHTSADGTMKHCQISSKVHGQFPHNLVVLSCLCWRFEHEHMVDLPVTKSTLNPGNLEQYLAHRQICLQRDASILLGGLIMLRHAAGVESKEPSRSRRQAGEPASQSVAPKQREGQASSPELLESTGRAQPERQSALPATEDEAVSQQFEQVKP